MRPLSRFAALSPFAAFVILLSGCGSQEPLKAIESSIAFGGISPGSEPIEFKYDGNFAIEPESVNAEFRLSQEVETKGISGELEIIFEFGGVGQLTSHAKIYGDRIKCQQRFGCRINE
ncbi:MAG: hypothetical protein KDA85_06755, partial [Planctomycetaceae bacterium]|nr:hypothetical protein [Planctomycetaceae bacterium]